MIRKTALWLLAMTCALAAATGPETETVESLRSSVRVEFDPFAVPRIIAEDYRDAASALGFVHAQERFFQMDLLRRRAAGRLSEILGSQTLNADRSMRAYGFEQVAEQVVELLPSRHREWLQAYRDGVNAGLQRLFSAPLEYTILGVEPAPWRVEDSILVLLDMTATLRSGEQEDRVLAGLRAGLPAELVEFLWPRTTRFDAPLDADEQDPTGGYRPVPIPSSEVFSVALLDHNSFRPGSIRTELPVLGSNSWAIAGSRTTHGHAVVANDMHLPLLLPNIWYRATMEWTENDDEPRVAAGVTLPGLPAIVAGSSNSIAWGFTNLTADLVDLVPLDVPAEDPTRYRYQDEFEPIAVRAEIVEVLGAEPVKFDVRSTRWGPIVGESHDGTPLAMRWGALDPANTNLRLLDLPTARTLEEALAIAREWRGPAQNIVLADLNGDIAWTITGFVPHRIGFGGGLDPGWSRGTVRWLGNLEGLHRPQIVRPASGILFTANNRIVSIGEGGNTLGSDFASGTRAMRIRELLGQPGDWSEREVFDVALDTRSRLYDPYRRMLIDAMSDQTNRDELASRAIEIIAAWDGTSNADQAAFRMLRNFRSRIHRIILAPLLAPVERRFPDWSYSAFNADEPVLRLLEEQPDHLLNPSYSSWEGLLRHEFLTMIREMGPGGGGGIETPWGERNRSRITHPFADRVPQSMRAALAIESSPQSGDTSSVRVARPTFGASERFAISPARLDHGLIHMPGGQSGKPLSRHFRDQQPAWEAGEPLSLLPGEAIRVLLLHPDNSDLPQSDLERED